MQRLTLLLFSIVSGTCFYSPLFSSEILNDLQIIERKNFQKKVLTDNLKNSVDGKLRDYHTFSIYVSEKLIFCHFSNAGSEPREYLGAGQRHSASVDTHKVHGTAVPMRPCTRDNARVLFTS